MTTGKHTPGPWAAEYARAGSSLVIKNQEGSIIAEVYQWKTSVVQSVKDEPPLNASLIAAAPDLLASLDGLFEIGTVFMSAIEGNDHLTDFEKWAEKARAAIAKARGESK